MESAWTVLLRIEPIKLLRLSQREHTADVLEEASFVEVRASGISDKEISGLVLAIGERFCYQLYQESLVYVTGYETYRSYLLPLPCGSNVSILISSASTTLEAFEMLDDILSSVSNLIYYDRSEDGAKRSIEAIQLSQSKLTQHPLTEEECQPTSLSSLVAMYNPTLDASEIGKKQISDGMSESSVDDEVMTVKPTKDSNVVAKVISGSGQLIGKGIQTCSWLAKIGVKGTGSLLKAIVPQGKVGEKPAPQNSSTTYAVEFLKDSTSRMKKISGVTAATVIAVSSNIGGEIFDYSKRVLWKKKDEGSSSSNDSNVSLQYLQEIAQASVGGAV